MSEGGLDDACNGGFHELVEKRKAFIRAARDNGFGEGIENLLTQLYPDEAHFIYELLQNADDAGARSVSFELRADRLVVEHDGTRLFSLADVDGITSIGKGTKADDETRIGKFGVGFKAVFAYTSTPVVHSGGCSFEISQLVLPRRVARPGDLAEDRTRFEFPFDHPRKPQAQAVFETRKGLQGLSPRTLLFLNHIERITFTAPGHNRHVLSRAWLGDGFVRLDRVNAATSTTASEWFLIVAKDVEVREDGLRRNVRVAAALQCTNPELGRVSFRPLEGGVHIFFPAVKERPGLRFLVHAPFASTVARDGIRDTPANAVLVRGIGQAIREALPGLRDSGRLTPSLLACLPNSGDDLASNVLSIRDEVLDGFRDDPVAPTRDGQWARGLDLCHTEDGLQGLLDPVELTFLLEPEEGLPQPDDDRLWRWIGWTGPVSDDAAQLLADVAGTIYSADELREGIPAAHRTDPAALSKMLGARSVPAMARLYAALAGRLASMLALPHDTKFKAQFVDIPMIRVAGSESLHSPAEVHLPADVMPPSGPPAGVRLVDPDVLADPHTKVRIRGFLEALGITPYDPLAAALHVLNTHYANGGPALEVHLEHMRTVFLPLFRRSTWGSVSEYTWAEKQRRFAKELAGHRFLLDRDHKWRAARDLYYDGPVGQTFLDEVEEARPGITKRFRVAEAYEAFKGEGRALLELLGVFTGPSVEKTSTWGNPARGQLRSASNWGKVTDYEIDEDFLIPDLDAYLAAGSRGWNAWLWNKLMVVDRTSWTSARYRPNKSAALAHAPSRLLLTLRSTAWVYDTEGHPKRPAEITVKDLADDFSARALTQANMDDLQLGLHAREKVKEQQKREAAAREAGFANAGQLDLAKAALDSLGEEGLQQLLFERAETRHAAVTDAKQRRNRAGSRATANPKVRREQTERIIRRRPSTDRAESMMVLRELYTDPITKNVVCQICRKPMPFQDLTGQWYFEVVQILKLGHEDLHNRMALCPTCSAKYTYARVLKEPALRRMILDTPVRDGDTVIEVTLSLANEDHTITFDAGHFLDLQGAIDADQEPEEPLGR